MDGLDARVRTSTTEFVRVPLSKNNNGGGRECVLTASPAASNADAAKVKISALVVMACDTPACDALQYISPKRVDF